MTKQGQPGEVITMVSGIEPEECGDMTLRCIIDAASEGIKVRFSARKSIDSETISIA